MRASKRARVTPAPCLTRAEETLRKYAAQAALKLDSAVGSWDLFVLNERGGLADISLETPGSLGNYNLRKAEYLMEDIRGFHQILRRQHGGLSAIMPSASTLSPPCRPSRPALDLLNFPDPVQIVEVNCVSGLKRRDIRRMVQVPEVNVGSSSSLEFLTESHAFMTPSHICKAVIFDTGASLAITPDKSDFDGPLTIPKGDLWLGGMVNGLVIEGVGPVTWTFTNPDGTEVRIRSMAYYVIIFSCLS